MANDNFNFTPEDISAISGTFQDDARIRRRRRERDEERREGRGFWGDLGMTLASGVVQQAVVEPITESVAGFINRPFADRDNIFLKSLREDTTKGQRLARERIKVDLVTDTNAQAQGLTDVQRAANSITPSIMTDLKRQAKLGSLKNALGDKISMQELLKDNTLNILAEELATQSVTANNNAGVNAYNAKINAGRLLDLTREGDASLKKHYEQYNVLERNWLDKGLNMLRGRSSEDLITIATEKIKTTDRYKRNQAVQEAIENWDKFQNSESIQQLTKAENLANFYETFDEGVLDKKTYNFVTRQKIIDGVTHTANGVVESTQEFGKPPSPGVFKPDVDGWVKTTTAREKVREYGSIPTAIKNLGKNISDKALLKLNRDLNGPQFQINGKQINWSAMETYAGQPGFLKLVEEAFEIVNKVPLDKKNFRPGFSQAHREYQILAQSTAVASRERHRLRMEASDLTPEEQIIRTNEFLEAQAYSVQVRAGLASELISLQPDGINAMPNYSVPALDGDGQIIPGSYENDLTQGKTNGEHAVADLYFEKWQLSREPTQVEIDTVIKSTPNADELASVTAQRDAEEIEKRATAEQVAADAAATTAAEVKAAKTAAADAAAIEAFNAVGLDGILEENTTIKEITRGRGKSRRTTTGRFLNEGVGHGPTLKATVNELGSRIPLKDVRSLLAEMGLSATEPTNFKTINQWFTANKEKIAVALATNKNVYSLFKEEGHAGLYRKFNNEYVNRRNVE